MKRFWKSVEVVIDGDGFAIALDGRRVKTPARADLVVPTPSLADAIAAEWQETGEEIDPRAMPLTGLANAAIDRVQPDPEQFADTVARYAAGDLFCYRADTPAGLVARQTASWDPKLDWARRRFDVDFRVVTGIMHQDQPEGTQARLAHAVAALDPFRLAALSPLTTISGSLITALAVLEGAMSPDEAWQAVTLDEAWQAEQWGADAEAEAALHARRRDFDAAARFLSLLD